MHKGHIKQKYEHLDEIIGANLRFTRLKRGVTQMEIAEALGATFQQIQKYERGVNRIASSTLYRFSEILDVPLLTFYQGVLPGTKPLTEQLLKKAGKKPGLEISVEDAEIHRHYSSLPPPLRQAVRRVLASMAGAAAPVPPYRNR